MNSLVDESISGGVGMCHGRGGRGFFFFCSVAKRVFLIRVDVCVAFTGVGRLGGRGVHIADIWHFFLRRHAVPQAARFFIMQSRYPV